jgi:hypothetical protein
MFGKIFDWNPKRNAILKPVDCGEFGLLGRQLALSSGSLCETAGACGDTKAETEVILIHTMFLIILVVFECWHVYQQQQQPTTSSITTSTTTTTTTSKRTVWAANEDADCQSAQRRDFRDVHIVSVNLKFKSKKGGPQRT